MFRTTLRALLGLLSILALAVVLWAPLVPDLLPRLDLQPLGGPDRVRLLAAGASVALFVRRILARPPKEPSKQDIVWGEFARAVGGSLTQERRGIGPLGWTGGATVRWNVHGVGVALTTSVDPDRNRDTHFEADVTMARPFQCHAVHESLLTKVLFSPQLWNVALRAVNTASDRLAFLAAKEILVGDPRMDETFLIKTDTPDRAREFFVDAGVSCALHGLDGLCHGWQLSLMWRGAGEHQLTLVVPGAMTDARELEAARALVEASIRCLADRGMLAPASSRAA
jgi:hypothetical protein